MPASFVGFPQGNFTPVGVVGEAALLKMAVEATDHSVVISALDTRNNTSCVVYVNAGFEAMMGYTKADIMGQVPAEVLRGPQSDIAAMDAMRRAVSSGEAIRQNVVLYHRDGHPMDIQWDIKPVSADNSGAITHYVAVLKNLTDINRMDSEIKAMNKEIYHRIKNMLAVIGGIVTLTGKAHSTPPATIKRIRDRIEAIGASHDVAYQRVSDDSRSDLHSVITRVLEPYRSSGNMEIDGEAYLLQVDQIVPITMFLHELASNALHHGALAQPDGHVLVHWRLENVTGTPQLRLRWSECSNTLVNPPEATGLGIKLLGQMARQLGGTHSVTWHPNGVSVELVV